MTDQPEFVERMRAVAKHLQSAANLMARGPIEYDFAKLAEQSAALLTRFAPIKVGGRAVIIHEVPCTGGWKDVVGLAVGNAGVVHDVDYHDGRFVFTFVPDVQAWRDDKGTMHTLSPSQAPYSYGLSEKYLTALATEPE